MPKSIYVEYLSQRPNSNLHYLNRLVKVLNHFISIEPPKKIKGYESHHIVPKCKSWKPEWKKVKDNLLKVPTKAHYVIHHLMYKAFPKDFAMTKAFHQMSIRLDEKITAKVFEILKVEVSKAQSKNNLKRVSDGSHNLLNSTHQKEMVANGSHHFLGGKIQRQSALKRVADGTNPFLNGELAQKRALKRVADGTHHFLDGGKSSKLQIERLKNGTHPSQIKKTCPHCGKTCSSTNYGRWHRK